MSLRQKILFALTLFICVISQTLPIIRSGLHYSYGLGFWGPMGHDGIWHLALINQIRNPFHIPAPSFAGELLQNYHPFFDIFIAFFSSLTHISASIWLFQIGPILISLAFLVLSFVLGYRLTHRYLGGIILVFLNTFSNSFGWLVSLTRGQGIGGESLFWSMQPPSFHLNPPFALSMVFIYLLLIIACFNQKKFSVTSSILVVTILGLLPITKAYAGVAAFLFFGFYSLYQLIQRHYRPLVILCASFVVAICIFRIYNHSSISLIQYQPFSLINSMIDSPDRFYLPRVSSFRQNISSSNVFDPRLIVVILGSVSIFIVGNYSWRLLGFTISRQRIKDYFIGPIILTIILLTLFPILFVQQATAWNIVQFLYYAIFLSNILLVVFLVPRLSSTFFSLATIVIFSTSILAVIPTYQNYLGNPSPASLPVGELEALSFLRLQPTGIVLTYPYDPEVKKGYSSTPIPLYAYETTAYVSAFSHHRTFLEDQMNLNNSAYNWQSRLDAVNKFFSQQSVFTNRGFLLNNQIDYIYLTTTQAKLIQLSETAISVEIIFQNSSAVIYRVKK